MKKNKFFINKIFLLILLFFVYSCGSISYVEIKTDIAKKIPFSFEQFDEIMITDFLPENEIPDFDINKEMKDYFAQEIEVKTKRKVSTKKIPLEDEQIFKNKQFWANISEKDEKGIFITGSVEYKKEVRKALVRDKRKFEDPFTYEDQFIQRKMFSLALDLYFINSQTGEIIYQRKFNESKSYENPNQTAYFAFYDLIYSMKQKIFLDVLTEKQPQERYLIIK